MDTSAQHVKKSRSKDKSATKRHNKAVKIGAVAAIVVGIAILTYPFIPYIHFQLFPPDQSSVEVTYQTDSETGEVLQGLPISEENQSIEDLSGNRVIIPKIGVNAKVVEGESDQALLKGAWHLPSTSTPDQGSNTVITGHRFRFLPPNNTTFYLLDKLGVDDQITVIWEDKEYHYKVKETKVVTPEQVEILEPSDQSILTLFTCTPLFTSEKRLVIISELI
jgi:sortase A